MNLQLDWGDDVKNIGTLALTKLLNLVRGELNKRPDQEISDSEVSQLFKSIGGIGYAGANTSTDAPVGTIITYMGVRPPLGYLMCDGSEHKIDEYPALVKHFEEQFGECNYFGGNGEDTFCVPDMNGRFALGHNDDKYHIGDIGGEAQHTLSVGELPKHTHAMVIRFDNGSYDISSGHANAGLDFTNYSDSNRIYNQMFVGSSVGAKKYHEATYSPISYKGSDVPHNNMPPFMVVSYCIKAYPVIENTTYTTDEVIVGTWINGSALYRKVIPVNVTSSGRTETKFDFSNKNLISIKGWLTSNVANFNTAYYTAPTDCVYVYRWGNTIVVKIGEYEVENLSDITVYVILEYTKKSE